MSGKLKEKEDQLRKILNDPGIEPGDEVEFDLTNAHVVVILSPLTTQADVYCQQMQQALALARKNRALINQGKQLDTDSAEAIRANREERDQELTE
jgi:hypothetical protein